MFMKWWLCIGMSIFAMMVIASIIEERRKDIIRQYREKVRKVYDKKRWENNIRG